MKDWLKQTIIDKSRLFLTEGKEVQPMFFGADAEGKLIVVPFSQFMQSEAGKDRAVAVGRGLVKTHRLELTALVYEAWVSTADMLESGIRPSQDPKRQELLIITLETPTDLEVTTIPIKNRRLQLADIDTLQEVETRFRFFVSFEPPPLVA